MWKQRRGQSLETQPTGTGDHAPATGAGQGARGNAFAQDHLARRRAQAARADAAFRKLLQLHERLQKLSEQARDERNIYASLDTQGVGGGLSGRFSEGAGKVYDRIQDVLPELARVLGDNADGSGGASDSADLAALEAAVNKARRIKTDSDIDMNHQTERSRPDDSVGGGAAYVGGATATGIAASAYGAATSLPLVGPAVDAVAGKDVRNFMVDAGTAMTGDREISEMAHDRGKAVGVTAGTLTQVLAAGGVGMGSAGARTQQAASVVGQMGTAQDVVVGTHNAATGTDLWTGDELTGGQRVMAGVGAATAGFGTMAKLDNNAKVANAAAEMNQTVARPNALQQVSRGFDAGKGAATTVDSGVVAATGRSLIDPRKEKSGAERVLAGASGAGSAIRAVADSTQTGRFATAIGQRSTAQQVGDGLTKSKAVAEYGDRLLTLGTNMSLINPGEKSEKDRFDAAGDLVGATAVGGKKALDKATDFSDIDIGLCSEDLGM